MNSIPFSRAWAMPSGDTFSVKPIGYFVDSYMRTSRISVDPFARNQSRATHTNDINPNTSAQYHMDAGEFLSKMRDMGVKPDLVIFDPPYSPRQVQECYAEIGLTPTMRDTQTAASKRDWRNRINDLAPVGCVCLSFGWNSCGMGNGWEILEIMLVAHGGDHNDTICMAERRISKQEELAL